MQSYKRLLFPAMVSFIPLFGMETDTVLRRSRGNSSAAVQTLITHQADSPLGSRPHTPLEPTNIGFFTNEQTEEFSDQETDGQTEVLSDRENQTKDSESAYQNEQNIKSHAISTQTQVATKPSSHYLRVDKNRPSRADTNPAWRDKTPCALSIETHHGLSQAAIDEIVLLAAAEKNLSNLSTELDSITSVIVEALTPSPRQKDPHNRFAGLEEVFTEPFEEEL